VRFLGRNDELLAELQRFSSCPPLTLISATNVECIEIEVQELKRFCFRKRHIAETSSSRMTFLSPSNIEEASWDIGANHHQKR
jgi:hypothetical protein